MKLGTQTGSLVNHLYGRMVIGQPEPFVGMGCTVLGWTDRHAATIVRMSSDKKEFTVRRDHAKVIAGSQHDGSAQYEYSANPDGRETTFKLDRAGTYRQVRLNERDNWVFVQGGGKGIRLGEREEYYDPSF